MPTDTDAPEDDTTETTTETSTDTDETTDWKAEAEKFRALSRKQEERAKANADAARELKQLREQSMSETEKAVAAAREEARNEALAEIRTERVEAAFRIDAAGRPIDIDDLLEGTNLDRFTGEDGKPDKKKITAFLDNLAPKGEGRQTPRVPTGQRTTPPQKPDMNVLLRAAAGRG